jgi:3-hydroxyisobutyrate dehydrogenase
MTKVGLIGLGNMGHAMAERLLGRGHPVIGWNRSCDALDRLTTRGGTLLDTPRSVARDAELVLVTTSDEHALKEVIEGQEGLLAGLAESRATLVQMSTVAPRTCQWLAGVVPPTVGLLDAPVMGSVDAARAGELTVFAGGERETLERCRPVLADLGQIRWVGPVGAASAAKLVANSALFGLVAHLGESLALAAGLGLEARTAFEVLAATPLAAQAERRRPSVEKDSYPTRFSLNLAAKDVRLIREAMERHGVEMRLGPATWSWIETALAEGYGEDDYTVMLRSTSGH